MTLDVHVLHTLNTFAAHHDGATLTALVAAEDGSWIERHTGHDPVALGMELAGASTRHT